MIGKNALPAVSTVIFIDREKQNHRNVSKKLSSFQSIYKTVWDLILQKSHKWPESMNCTNSKNLVLNDYFQNNYLLIVCQYLQSSLIFPPLLLRFPSPSNNFLCYSSVTQIYFPHQTFFILFLYSNQNSHNLLMIMTSFIKKKFSITG